PPRRLGKIREGSLDDLPGLAADLAGLAGELSDLWQIERPDTIRAAAYAAPDGQVRVVFVTSTALKPTTGVLLAEATALRDPFTGERIVVTAGKATIAMHARGVRMLLVER
ncbi:MAG: hypothetical protein H0T79_13815, partial [Deltaproteobacteria bacterium]|nr:hypothetical protein [Deltaproteobacteria bacterium]